MNEQSDNLARLIHDAAGQVGPLDGIDGEAMAGRAIRRERARRGVIGGAVALVVVALVTVGGLAASGRQVLPAGWLPEQVPADWTRVSGTGLTLAVPPDFEPFESMGLPAWGVDPELDEEWSTAESMVTVVPLPLEGDYPLSDEYSHLTQTEVQGATSASYAWEAAAGSNDLQGALDVVLESGRTLRLVVTLTGIPEPERTFEQLVGTVRVDRSFDESELSMAEDEQLTLSAIQELPSDWAVQEHQGLRFAVPGDWVEDDASAARSASWPALSMNDAAGEFRLQVTALATTFDSDEDHSYMYLFEPPPGADRAGAELTPEGGTLTAWIEVRRAGGRAYSIDVQVPEGEDGERIVRTIAGNMEFTAAADDLPSYEDLEDAQPFVDDAPEIPEDWVVAEGSGFSLRVPPEWADPEGDAGSDDGTVLRNSPSDVEPGESVDAWLEEPGVLGTGEIPIGGYRLDVPGADQAVVRLGDYTEYGEAETFSANAEVRLADGSHVFVGYDGPAGPEFEERFWQIIGSLEVVDP